MYSGWRLGKRKPEVVTDGEGLVEAAGESIEIWGVRFRGSVRVGSGEGDNASVISLCNEAFSKEAVAFGESGGGYVREAGRYAICKGMGSGVSFGGEKASCGQHQENVGAWSKVVLNAAGPPRGVVVPVVPLVHSYSF